MYVGARRHWHNARHTHDGQLRHQHARLAAGCHSLTLRHGQMDVYLGHGGVRVLLQSLLLGCLACRKLFQFIGLLYANTYISM
jgi:hypothetical protein